MKATPRVVTIADARTFYKSTVKPFIVATRKPGQTLAQAHQAGWQEMLRMMVKNHIIGQEQCDQWKNETP